MRSYIENIEMEGHLQVVKLYSDGTEEIVFDDHNIIVSGMGFGLSRMFSAGGSDNLLDYQIDRFQIGVSGSEELEVSSTTQLAGALTTLNEYGLNSNLILESATQIVNGVDFNNKIFAKIPKSKIDKIDSNAAKYTLVLDQDSCNDKTLNEVGLFMKNPTGAPQNKSILVAYRSFSDIVKTSDFSLIFRWTLYFPYQISDLLVPAFADEYFGLSSTPSSERRNTQNLDVYQPDRLLDGGNACVIWVHAGALTGGDKAAQLPAYFATKCLERDLVFISPNYALATNSGELQSGASAFPVNYPIFTDGQGFGSTDDSNDDLVPSSIAPFRLPNGRENAFTDAVRMLQFVKYNADRYNINKDRIVLAGGAAGGDITSWLALAPEVSATTSDPVEAESIKVYAAANKNTITNWLTWYSFNTGNARPYEPVPAGKTVLDMSGSVYVPSGTGITETSGYDYLSGNYFSQTLYDLPDHLKYSLGVLFANSIGNSSFGVSGAFESDVSSFHDWASIPGLLGAYQYREAPLLTKKFWSAYYHASAGVESEGLTWGKLDNSAVYMQFQNIGISASAAGFSDAPWQIIINNSTGLAQAGLPDLSSLWSRGPLYTLGYEWNFLDPDAPNGIASGITLQNHLISASGVAEALTIAGYLGIIDGLDLLSLSGFGWGPPTNGIDTYDVSALIERFTGTGYYIPSPYINIDFSGVGGVDSSAVGNASALSGTTLTFDPHDPVMPIEMLEELRTNLGGVHTTSSVLQWLDKDKYINAVNYYGILDTQYKENEENIRTEWIIGILANNFSHYNQFKGTLSTSGVTEL